ncbi:uncharacterized protein BX663DRAFT_499499 [Cokeromyces recurvatus]|uniref:uncharacterized protein n=1 Tax=Cokeromyces recurvatus TaxID=90255 RepID=UPI00222003B6|nr:uncharacterized protein BX663DRAFT_499499 [Cokeromyces recurvatus]KAI7905372.1 hypothetical protein BX663DRAFT_499499 [Cokeromyces recurvatus]
MKTAQNDIFEIASLQQLHMLNFDIVYADGGEFGSMYGIHNILLNNGSVYCSRRRGAINILTQYRGYVESGIITDKTCSISKMVIRAPRFGFTAPCKDGLIFISHKEINVSDTAMFDHFTKQDYEDYVKTKMESHDGILDDNDPVAWFTLTNEEDITTIINLNFRSGKYVLIKLLRAYDYNGSAENIDIQYIGFIGCSGPRAFGWAKLC